MIKQHKDISIAPYTHYKIGGVASEVYFPSNAGELLEVLEELTKNNIPYYLLGGGSNVLVGDGYWDGAVIITTGMNGYEVHDDCIVCGAGLESSQVAKIALEHAKTGFEFLYLLPGSIGGALAMNARYEMKSISQVLISFVAAHPEKGLKTFQRSDVNFDYKHNSITSEGWIICELKLSWQDCDPETIRRHMAEIETKRTEDHHFDFPSCGCIFKNDYEHNIQAGRLLDELSFKGFSVGDAQVSQSHANFIINTGNADARDVLALIEHIERVVKEKTGIVLEREVRLVGTF